MPSVRLPRCARCRHRRRPDPRSLGTISSQLSLEPGSGLWVDGTSTGALEGIIRIDLSDDECRIPLRIESAMPLAGTAVLTLESHGYPAGECSAGSTRAAPGVARPGSGLDVPRAAPGGSRHTRQAVVGSVRVNVEP